MSVPDPAVTSAELLNKYYAERSMNVRKWDHVFYGDAPQDIGNINENEEMNLRQYIWLTKDLPRPTPRTAHLNGWLTVLKYVLVPDRLSDPEKYAQVYEQREREMSAQYPRLLNPGASGLGATGQPGNKGHHNEGKLTLIEAPMCSTCGHSPVLQSTGGSGCSRCSKCEEKALLQSTEEASKKRAAQAPPVKKSGILGAFTDLFAPKDQTPTHSQPVKTIAHYKSHPKAHTSSIHPKPAHKSHSIHAAVSEHTSAPTHVAAPAQATHPVSIAVPKEPAPIHHFAPAPHKPKISLKTGKPIRHSVHEPAAKSHPRSGHVPPAKLHHTKAKSSNMHSTDACVTCHDITDALTAPLGARCGTCHSHSEYLISSTGSQGYVAHTTTCGTLASTSANCPSCHSKACGDLGAKSPTNCSVCQARYQTMPPHGQYLIQPVTPKCVGCGVPCSTLISSLPPDGYVAHTSTCGTLASTSANCPSCHAKACGDLGAKSPTQCNVCQGRALASTTAANCSACRDRSLVSTTATSCDACHHKYGSLSSSATTNCAPSHGSVLSPIIPNSEVCTGRYLTSNTTAGCAPGHGSVLSPITPDSEASQYRYLTSNAAVSCGVAHEGKTLNPSHQADCGVGHDSTKTLSPSYQADCDFCHTSLSSTASTRCGACHTMSDGRPDMTIPYVQNVDFHSLDEATRTLQRMRHEITVPHKIIIFLNDGTGYVTWYDDKDPNSTFGYANSKNLTNTFTRSDLTRDRPAFFVTSH